MKPHDDSQYWFVTGNDLPDYLVNGLLATIKPVKSKIEYNTAALLRSALGSMSLGLTEKNKVLEAMPTLSTFQVDELFKTFNAEKVKFHALGKKHPAEIFLLSAKTIVGIYALATYRGAVSFEPHEEAGAIRSLVVDKLKQTPKLKKKLHEIGKLPFAVSHVYGVALESRPSGLGGHFEF